MVDTQCDKAHFGSAIGIRFASCVIRRARLFYISVLLLLYDMVLVITYRSSKFYVVLLRGTRYVRTYRVCSRA